jgi:hypothetical protein
LLGLVSGVGCGSSNRASVEGKVLLDGQPLKTGVINFMPTEDNPGPTAGGTIVDGHYKIDAERGVAIGLNRVVISSKQPTGRKIQSLDRVDEEIAEVVPSQYNTKSTLTRDIQAGANEQDFELEGRVSSNSHRRSYPRN